MVVLDRYRIAVLGEMKRNRPADANGTSSYERKLFHPSACVFRATLARKIAECAQKGLRADGSRCSCNSNEALARREIVAQPVIKIATPHWSSQVSSL